MVTEEDNDLHIIVPDYIPIKIERILDSEGRHVKPSNNKDPSQLAHHPVSAHQEETRNVANTCFSLVSPERS